MTQHTAPQPATPRSTEAPSLKTLPGASRATLLTPPQLAARWQMPEKTLSVWRSTNRVRLPYLKVGGAVRYRIVDIEKFEADNLRATAQG